MDSNGGSIQGPGQNKIQVSPTYQAYQSRSKGTKQEDILLACTEACISLLIYLNASLRVFSNSVLQNDLLTDEKFAHELSAIQMVPVPPGDTASHHAATFINTQRVNAQQYIQAEMKAAQANEQSDLMAANATTTNAANTTSQIQALQSVFVQLATAIAQMCR